MNKLKLCPFCVGEAFVYKRYDSIFRLDPTDFTVLCKECRGGVRHYFQTESEAIAAWNRRVNDD